ncbi:hypothetical protein VCPCS023_003727A, partial [Vibrio cholerae O1 str. PCS-023]
MSLVVMR